MAETTADVRVKVFQMIIISFILLVLIYRKRKNKIRPLNWFIAIFLLADIQGIAELLIYYIKIYQLNLDNPSFFRFNEFHTIPYSLAILTLFLLSEAMSARSPNIYRFSLVFGLWVSYLSVMMFQTFHNYNIVFSNIPAAHQTFNVIFDLFQFTAMLMVSYTFLNAYKLSKNPQNKRATFLILIAGLTYSLALLYEFGETLLGFPDVYGAITFSFTFLIMAFVYIRYPYFVFSVPTKIYRLILTTNSGLHLYSADIEHPMGIGSDELLAGGVSALTTFIGEAVGSKESLKYAVMGDRALLVSRFQNLVGFVIGDKATYILRNALDQFVTEFHNKYQDLLENFNAQVSQFTESTKIIARCFPFVEANDIISLQLNS